jgi:isopenicillin-N epimerase
VQYLLDPSVTFLNHGSYGACPEPVFDRYQELQRELERNPVEFLGRRFDGLLAEAREALAGFVGARADDLVFVPNATAALNTVIRSLSLEPGDEVVTTRHEYGAVTRTWEFAGATLVHAEPEEVADAIGPRTRAVSVSHITSPTALVLPVAEICAAARAVGALAIVDGAHAPGQLPLDLEALGADVYAGNCHKWLSAPKGSAFLWARADHHAWIDPLVVSWGYDDGFAARHGWQGTRDPAAALAVPAAIEAHSWAAVLCPPTQGLQLRHVRFVQRRGMRSRERRLHHFPSDLPPCGAECHTLHRPPVGEIWQWLTVGCELRWLYWGSRHFGCLVGRGLWRTDGRGLAIDVFLCHPPARTAAPDCGQIDPEFACASAHRRCGQDTPFARFRARLVGGATVDGLGYRARCRLSSHRLFSRGLLGGRRSRRRLSWSDGRPPFLVDRDEDRPHGNAVARLKMQP